MWKDIEKELPKKGGTYPAITLHTDGLKSRMYLIYLNGKWYYDGDSDEPYVLISEFGKTVIAWFDIPPYE
ncbi:MAG: hypothetical protein WA061_02570 [Microgenomates group bacterium]